MVIQIDKGTLAPEDYENTKLITLDDGSQEEVYISRAGNIVTHPKERGLSRFDGERRQLCWDLYVKSVRNGAPNARGAAIAAGFSENTAINIGNQRWFKEKKDKLRKSTMLSKAEKNLSKMLNLDYSKMKIHEDGTEEEIVDKDLLRVVYDVSKTVVTHLGKDEGWSTKTEVTGKMDSEIKINSISYADPIAIEGEVIDGAIEQIQGKTEELILDIVKENE